MNCDRSAGGKLVAIARRLLAPALIAASLGFAACGGSGTAGGASATSITDQSVAANRVGQADMAVIRGWAAALRAGNIGSAAAFWGLPAIVQNGGTEAFELSTINEVKLFQLTLPCGARVLAAIRLDGYINVAFRLVDRLGANADCGRGVGQRAYLALRIDKAKIVEWRRINEITEVPPAIDSGPQPDGSQESAPII
ncbi:MAG: hypothetical protein WCK06_03110 [Actinomycetota bacterium]